MLKSFGPEIWIEDGSVVAVMGYRYATRMVVIRLADNRLFIWSPIAVSSQLRAEIDELGEVAYLIAPNSLHHLFLEEWQRAYPLSQLFAPPGLRQKRKDLTFDVDLEDVPNPQWIDQIDQVVVRGNFITTEVVFFHLRSRTVLFTDLLQQFPKGWHTGWRSVVAKLDLMIEQEPTVPRKFRLAFTNRKIARMSVKHILDWPIENVLMAHGTPVSNDALGTTRRAFGWLMK